MIKKKKKNIKLKKKSKKLKVVAEKKSQTLQKGNSADEKVQIKKIKKQPTEKKLYAINQHVVYPKHGVGKIVAIEKAKIGDISINFYKVIIIL